MKRETFYPFLHLGKWRQLSHSGVSASSLQLRCIYTHRLSNHVILICLWRQRLKPSVEMYIYKQTLTLCNLCLYLASAPPDFNWDVYIYTDPHIMLSLFVFGVSASSLQLRCIHARRLSHYVIPFCLWHQRLKTSCVYIHTESHTM